MSIRGRRNSLPSHHIAGAQFGGFGDRLPPRLRLFRQAGKECHVPCRSWDAAPLDIQGLEGRFPSLRCGLLQRVGHETDTVIPVTPNRAIHPCLVLIQRAGHRLELIDRFVKQRPTGGGRLCPLNSPTHHPQATALRTQHQKRSRRQMLAATPTGDGMSSFMVCASERLSTSSSATAECGAAATRWRQQAA